MKQRTLNSNWFHPLMLSVLMLLSGFTSAAQQGKLADQRAALAGNWTGASICVNKEKFPACHDEQVIYRIAPTSGSADKVNLTMDKLVDGKPEFMGEMECTYDSQHGTLVSEYTYRNNHLRWEFTVKENTLTGTLAALPDKTLVRQIKVRKEAQ
ncbi:MAG: hypothetical protein HYR56_23125 [Acidobacteria bacterium]|nr:hypothetical protein [Acidobacteriota bacterium]MBI3427836.1 hypothetical protein [Acidobacteriota bacterium]